MAVTTSIRLNAHLADEAKKVLGVKSGTEAVHALRERTHPILTPTEKKW
jgi:hypothetical protein